MPFGCGGSPFLAPAASSSRHLRALGRVGRLLLVGGRSLVVVACFVVGGRRRAGGMIRWHDAAVSINT